MPPTRPDMALHLAVTRQLPRTAVPVAAPAHRDLAARAAAALAETTPVGTAATAALAAATQAGTAAAAMLVGTAAAITATAEAAMEAEAATAAGRTSLDAALSEPLGALRVRGLFPEFA